MKRIINLGQDWKHPQIRRQRPGRECVAPAKKRGKIPRQIMYLFRPARSHSISTSSLKIMPERHAEPKMTPRCDHPEILLRNQSQLICNLALSCHSLLKLRVLNGVRNTITITALHQFPIQSPAIQDQREENKTKLSRRGAASNSNSVFGGLVPQYI